MPYGTELVPAALKGIKALGASKNLIPMLIGAGFFGKEFIVDPVNKAGERSLTREQIRLQQLLGENKLKAAKRATEESRSRADEYIKALMEAQKESRKESREELLLRSFMQGQDRQAMMLMQAIQGLSQPRPRYSSGSGMLGLMRGGM